MGNVWEWTCSVYDGNYGGAEQKCSKNDTVGPRVLRGGSGSGEPEGLRSAARDWLGPRLRSSNLGFRLAGHYNPLFFIILPFIPARSAGDFFEKLSTGSR